MTFGNILGAIARHRAAVCRQPEKPTPCWVFSRFMKFFAAFVVLVVLGVLAIPSLTLTHTLSASTGLALLAALTFK